MKTKLRMGLIAATAVTVTALALAVTANAQAAGPHDRGGDDRVAQRRAGRRLSQNIQPGRQANQARPAARSYGFVAHPNVDVDVTENDDGVTIHLTTEDADIAKKLQENLPERIEQLREHARTRAQRRQQVRERREERGIEVPEGLNLLASDEVRVEVVPTDAGADILMVSDNRDVVAQIKETVPQCIENARRFRKRVRALRQHVAEHPGAMLRGAQMLRLMLSPEVGSKLTETDNGVVIELFSDDPELAEKLKTVLPKRFESLRQLREKLGEAGPPPELMRQRMMQRRKRMEGPRMGPDARGQGQMLRRQKGAGRMAPGGRGQGRMLGPEAGPDEERMRELIRQEIRRYLEEEGTE